MVSRLPRWMVTPRAAWLLACAVSWLLCLPFFGPLGALAGIPVATLVFSPLAATLARYRRHRAAGPRRPGWDPRRLLRPESVVWLLSAAACTAVAAYLAPALPSPYAGALVAAVAAAALCSTAAQGLTHRGGQDAAPDRRLPQWTVTLWALVAALALGGAAWAVQGWTVPFRHGAWEPKGRTAPLGEALARVDQQVGAALFGPSFEQWYWPLLVCAAALVIGGGCAALREWPARWAARHDPFADAPEGTGPPRLTGTARVFLSYSRRDTAFAGRYVAELERHVRKVWVDWQGIQASEKWRRKIFDALRGSDAVIVLVSRNSLRSQWCRKECEEAVRLGKRILPVLIAPEPEGSASAALDAAGWGPLTEYQRLTMTADADFARGVRETLEFVAQQHQWVELHTLLGDQAHAWRASGFSEGLLLRPHELARAEAWRAHTPDTPGFRARPTAEQDAFIDRSRSAMRHRTRRFRLGVTAGLTAFAGLLSLVLTGQADAEEQRRAALSRRLAEAAQAPPYPGLVRSSLLAAAAYGRQDTYEARTAMATQLLRVNDAAAVLATGLRRTDTMAFSRDGSVFAVTLPDGTTRVWDTARWRLRGTVPGRLPYDPRRGLGADGRRLVVGRADRVEVRDTVSLRVVDTFRMAARPSSGGTWFGGLAPDGGRAVAAPAGSSATTRVRDVTGRRGLAAYPCAEPNLSPRGTRVWCNDPDAGRMRTTTGRPLGARLAHDPDLHTDRRALHGWTADEKAVVEDHGVGKVLGPGGREDVWVPDREMKPSAVSDDGERVLLTSTGLVSRRPDEVWDLKGRRKLGEVTFEELRTAGLSRSYDGTENDSRLPALVAAPPRLGMRLAALGGVLPMSLAGVRHSADGRRAVAVSDRGELVAWRLDGRGRIVTELPAEGPAVVANALSPDGRTLAVLRPDELALVGSADGHRRRTIPLTGTGWSVAYSPDGSRVAVGQTAGTGVPTAAGEERRSFVEVFATATGRRTATLRSTVRPNPRETPLAVAFAPDGRQVFLALAQECVVEQWRLADRRSVRTYGSYQENGHVNAMALSPDGRTLATADRESQVRLWDTATGALRRRVEGGTEVTFAPDGASFATVEGYGTTVQLRDTRTGERLGPAFDVGDRARETVHRLRISPDGRHLLVVTQPLAELNDSRLWVWDLRQRARIGTRLARVEGRAEPQVTPDGGRVLLAGAGTLVSVDLDPGHWQAALCSLAGRRLTKAEWRAAAPGQRYPDSCGGR